VNPGFVDEQVREKKNRLNNGNKNGYASFQGRRSSGSEVAIPLSNWMSELALRLLPLSRKRYLYYCLTGPVCGVLLSPTRPGV
jgi:hypothetical protein